MTNWADTIGKVFGISSQIAMTGAVYGFFSFLDKKASASAKSLLSRWIEGGSKEIHEVRHLLTSTFDKIYGPFLFGPRAMCISMSFTILSLLIWWLLAYILTGYIPAIFIILDTRGFLLFAPNFVSDYVVLYIIRAFMRHPPFSMPATLSVAFTSSIFFILILYAILYFLLSDYFTDFMGIPGWEVYVLITMSATIPSSLFVNIWLILLSIGMIGARLIYLAAKGTTFAQWFIDHGSDHPFDAVGFVSAAVLFITLILYQLLNYLL